MCSANGNLHISARYAHIRLVVAKEERSVKNSIRTTIKN